jgi:N-acetyl-anhydromuramyl-L-alanine amidase AmpD
MRRGLWSLFLLNVAAQAMNVIPSKFYDERVTYAAQEKVKPKFIIVHFTANCELSESTKAFNNMQRPVSAHYLIDREGKISHMVPDEKRAWHAGQSCWQDIEDMNAYSIGIEIINPGNSEPDKEPCRNEQEVWNAQTAKRISGSASVWYAFTPAQTESVIKLCQRLMKKHHIGAQNVLGHSDIAPGRKVDPGPLFPWELLARQGIGLWWNAQDLELESFDIADLQKLLKKIGYNIKVTGLADEQTQKVVSAFQMHYQQDMISGIPDNTTYAIAKNLLQQLYL